MMELIPYISWVYSVEEWLHSCLQQQHSWCVIILEYLETIKEKKPTNFLLSFVSSQTFTVPCSYLKYTYNLQQLLPQYLSTSSVFFLAILPKPKHHQNLHLFECISVFRSHLGTNRINYQICILFLACSWTQSFFICICPQIP